MRLPIFVGSVRLTKDRTAKNHVVVWPKESHLKSSLPQSANCGSKVYGESGDAVSHPAGHQSDKIFQGLEEILLRETIEPMSLVIML